jgi:dephospho-CoA kinase
VCDHLPMAFVLFGLTGGLACGKSSVAARWRSRRLPIIDADELAREVVARGSDGLREITQAFGPEVITDAGDLDRKRLATRVFASAAERKRLEAITHPRITAASRDRAAELERAGEPLACYEATLLVERGIAESFRPLVVVTATEELQIARAVARGGISADEARARLRAQTPIEQKAALANWVIANDGAVDALVARADEVLDAICRSVGVDPSRYPVTQL